MNLRTLNTLIGSSILWLSLNQIGIAEPLSNEEASNNHQPITIAIIIDDMGNNFELGQQALELPGAISYSFLPNTPHAKQLAEQAERRNKTVLIHLPMSNLNSQALGPEALTPRLNKQQFLQTLQRNLDAIPNASGVNNHMGSLLTQLHAPMDWLTSALKQQQKYVIDSRTSPLTVLQSTAEKKNIPTLKRDVFLDNTRSFSAIDAAFKQLIKKAKQQRIAVAIGHPYPETLNYLALMIPQLEQQGIRLISTNDAIRHPSQNLSTPLVRTSTSKSSNF
ncbi:divergent polysaccharide deacetylase family protein [bacterium]|nr:divergent polysaccharide deacetylase family protein [bacterium]